MIDAHLHLQDSHLQSVLPAVLKQAKTQGIQKLVVNGTHPEDWDRVEALAHQSPLVLPSFGLHPWWVGREASHWLENLGERLERHPEAAVGEIGLDRWIRGRDFSRQKEVFTAQLELAIRLDRPLTIHCLQAWGILLELVAEVAPSRPFLLHSYGGPREMVTDWLARGAYFSLSGYFFRPDKVDKLAVFDSVPDDRLLLESDAPDMLPPPEMQRFPLKDGDGQPLNHPGNLVALYEATAARRGWSLTETRDRLRQNFEAWYRGGGDSSDGGAGAAPA